MMALRTSRNRAYTFHVVAGIFTVILLFFPIIRALFSPIDVFARPEQFLVGHLQFLLAALVFYGFSLMLLRLIPLPILWSVLYTSTSWLFFLWAFYPVLPTSGMMRRIAVPYAEYLAAQRFRELLHMGAIVVFACIQIAYLLFVIRRTRGLSPPTA